MSTLSRLTSGAVVTVVAVLSAAPTAWAGIMGSGIRSDSLGIMGSGVHSALNKGIMGSGIRSDSLGIMGRDRKSVV
jgi:hypothetical protein